MRMARAHNNITGMCETSAEADVEAAICAASNVAAFQAAQQVMTESPRASAEEKHAKVLRKLNLGQMSASAESVVYSALAWTAEDDERLEELARLTPLDDALLEPLTLELLDDTLGLQRVRVLRAERALLRLEDLARQLFRVIQAPPGPVTGMLR